MIFRTRGSIAEPRARSGTTAPGTVVPVSVRVGHASTVDLFVAQTRPPRTEAANSHKAASSPGSQSTRRTRTIRWVRAPSASGCSRTRLESQAGVRNGRSRSRSGSPCGHGRAAWFLGKVVRSNSGACSAWCDSRVWIVVFGLTWCFGAWLPDSLDLQALSTQQRNRPKSIHFARRAGHRLPRLGASTPTYVTNGVPSGSLGRATRDKGVSLQHHESTQPLE